MKYCKECQSEYEDFVEVCSDCGSVLEDVSVRPQKEEDVHMTTAQLTSVDNDFEAERLLALLRSEGIEAMKKFKGSGSYLNIAAGYNFQGVDIYVHSAVLEQARELINALDIVSDEMPEEVPFEAHDVRKEEHWGNGFRWFIRIGYLIPLVLFIVYLLFMWVMKYA